MCRKKLVKLVDARSRSVEGRGLRKIELQTLEGISRRALHALFSGVDVLIRWASDVQVGAGIDDGVLVDLEFAVRGEAEFEPGQGFRGRAAGDGAILIEARAVAGAGEAGVADADDAAEVGAGGGDGGHFGA